MLVHICCSVDSHYFLQKLKKDYPDEKLVGYFYDPNIHPYSEYYLRLLDVRRSCNMLDIELLEGEYDVENWLEAVRGLENEPEKGARCSVCFDRRFEVTAQKAVDIGEKTFTSTLLTSPKKSLKQLSDAGNMLSSKYGISFVAPDYRKNSGTQEQNILAKNDALYRQDYCGCIFGLTMQREEQNRLADELFMPVSKQVQPESIEERILLYKQRWQYEENNIEYKIIKQRFLNWRLLSGSLRIRKMIVAAHFLPYSTLRGNYSRGKIEYMLGDVGIMNRDEIKFITLSRYNKLCNTDYDEVKSLLFNPPPFNTEVSVRENIIAQNYDLTTVIVVDEMPDKKIEVMLESKTYDDIREILLETAK